MMPPKYSRRKFLKASLVTIGGVSALFSEVKFNTSDGIKVGKSSIGLGMSEAQAQCGSGFNCSGSGGQCGSGFNCSGGGGQCGSDYNCSGSGGGSLQLRRRT